MPGFGSSIWNKNPFLRPLIFFIGGILAHQYLAPFYIQLQLFLIGILIISLVLALKLQKTFQFRFINGVFISTLFLTLGLIHSRIADIDHNKFQFQSRTTPYQYLQATITSPVSEKNKSLKTSAKIDFLISDSSKIHLDGKLLLYFQKNISKDSLLYGRQILIKIPAQPIQNAGNPAAFDFRKYCRYQGIGHQVYLKNEDFTFLSSTQKNWIWQNIYQCRNWVLATLRSHIDSSAIGLAEALLVGYKDDLDKQLVSSYSNTGTVHIIAISGLHLGLIYWLLITLLGRVRNKKLKLLKLMIVLAGLWTFTLLAGAQPSVLRSAVMFTFIACSEVLYRNGSILNSLAGSAFILLCLNPFNIWDIGFQLSYAAVTSIILFMKRIYSLMYFSNKFIDFVWQLTSVTLAAQILTTPVCIYHFHQFPNYFILANLFAVPISTLVLFSEIFLCFFSWIEPVADFIGAIATRLIRLMNFIISQVESLPYSVWKGLNINLTQLILLFVFIYFSSGWVQTRSIIKLKLALVSLIAIVVIRYLSFRTASKQKRIIVYNVPGKSATDLITGTKTTFLGDSSIAVRGPEYEFHIRNCRIIHRIGRVDFSQTGYNFLFIWNSMRIMKLSGALPLAKKQKDEIDLLILSGNPRIYLSQLSNYYNIRKIIFEPSTPKWKTELWKKDCDSLHIPYHDIKEKGAFVMTLR